MMLAGRGAALAVLLGCLTLPAEAQTSGRLVVVMVDDLRFTPSEAQNAEQLLALLRDELSTEADLVGIVTTGPSSVAEDLHSPADPQRLNDAIRRIATGRLEPVGEPARGAATQATGARFDAHIAFATATDVVRSLARLEGRSRHFVFVSSAATAATALAAAVAEPGGELAREVTELASMATRGHVTMRVVDAGDPVGARVLRR